MFLAAHYSRCSLDGGPCDKDGRHCVLVIDVVATKAELTAVGKAYILGKHDGHYSSMMMRVHGMFFFSTPHRGSGYAGLLNRILSVTIGVSSKVYVAELEPNSTSINTLNEQFRSNCGNLHLISLYETLPTKVPLGFKKIVGCRKDYTRLLHADFSLL